SATAAVKKQKKPSSCGSGGGAVVQRGRKPQRNPLCAAVVSRRLNVPALSSTPTTGIVRESTELTIRAELRRPPSSGYLLFDDQPARATPYTPSEVMAKRNSRPTFRSATASWVRWPKSVNSPGPNGIRAMAVSASDRERNGAR